LQLILPIVFYHGKQKWIFKTINDLLNYLPPELQQFIPAFKTVFIDLKNFSDEQLNSLGDSLLTSILLLEKYAFKPDELAKKLKLIYEKLNSVSDRNLLYPIIVYSMRLIKIDIIKTIIEELPIPIKSNVMTAYDTLIQEGRKEGKKEGREEGRKEGRVEGMEKGVINLYKRQFDIAHIADIMEISVEKVKSILKRNNMI